MELGLQLEECDVLIKMENVRKAARGCSVSKSKRDWSVGPKVSGNINIKMPLSSLIQKPPITLGLL